MEQASLSEQMGQAQREKAWPLHIDHNWETLPDLDPLDRRHELESIERQRRVSVVGLALGLTRGIIEAVEDEEGKRAFVLRVRPDKALPLSESLLGTADMFVGLRKEMPAVYDGWIAPLLANVAAMEDATKTELRQLVRNWAARAQDLELDGKTRSPEYRDLAECRAILAEVMAEVIGA